MLEEIVNGQFLRGSVKTFFSFPASTARLCVCSYWSVVCVYTYIYETCHLVIRSNYQKYSKPMYGREIDWQKLSYLLLVVRFKKYKDNWIGKQVDFVRVGVHFF